LNTDTSTKIYILREIPAFKTAFEDRRQDKKTAFEDRY
jgi:hypothetical protein